MEQLLGKAEKKKKKKKSLSELGSIDSPLSGSLKAPLPALNDRKNPLPNIRLSSSQNSLSQSEQDSDSKIGSSTEGTPLGAKPVGKSKASLKLISAVNDSSDVADSKDVMSSNDQLEM